MRPIKIHTDNKMVLSILNERIDKYNKNIEERVEKIVPLPMDIVLYIAKFCFTKIDIIVK
jgi:hypothetical protein